MLPNFFRLLSAKQKPRTLKQSVEGHQVANQCKSGLNRGFALAAETAGDDFLDSPVRKPKDDPRANFAIHPLQDSRLESACLNPAAGEVVCKRSEFAVRSVDFLGLQVAGGDESLIKSGSTSGTLADKAAISRSRFCSPDTKATLGSSR
jgi:hypothetical protein